MTPSTRSRVLLIGLVPAFALAACGTSDSETAPVDPTPSSFVLEASDTPQRDVPEQFVQNVLTAVADRTGLAAEDLTVSVATAVDWADQRLGCVAFADPAEPAPVDGYRVVVETTAGLFDYRLDAVGNAELCGDPIARGDDSPDEDPTHDEVPAESS